MLDPFFLKTYLHPLGRTTYFNKNEQGSLYFAHCNSGFSMRILARKGFCLHLKFISEVKLENQAQYVVVFLDQKFYKKYAFHHQEEQLMLEFPSLEGEHLFTLIKVNEPQYTRLYLLSVAATKGEILPYQDSFTKKMEFYGASTTSGFGILGNKEDPFTLKTEDSSLSFSYLTSQMLGYETSVISYSGMSMALKLHQPFTLLDVYDKMDGNLPWDFSFYTPDYIVIDIGTNDNEKLKQIAEDQKEEASKHYYKNLHQLAFLLHEKHPMAAFIFIHGMMVHLSPYLVESIERVKEELKKEKVAAYVLSFIPNQEGACAHPNQEAHQKIAAQIADFILKSEK